MTTLVVHGPSSISGETRVPGDKSISHRALMIGAVGHGASLIHNIAPGEDVASTMRCLESYGVPVTHIETTARVHGSGIQSWGSPSAPLDCGNSGTTMRLLAGLAAHNAFTSVLDGDASLRRRPMDRLVTPLEALGAQVDTSNGRPPVTIEGGQLSGAMIELDIASAQVKSCALFAALAADGSTTVCEPALSRDHTERLLHALGAPIAEQRLPDGSHRVDIARFAPPAFEIEVPGDPSSAAFLITAALLAGAVRIDGVGLNATRIAFFDVLQRMGAELHVEQTHEHMGEPVGSVESRRSQLGSVSIEGPIVPLVLDELPLLAVLATQARGTTTVIGAGELRVKESDRIATMIAALRAFGADADELPDGFTVRGPTVLAGTKVDGAGDHRVAMALAVAGLVANGETLVDGFESAGVSWPGFDRALGSLGADVVLR